MLAGNGASFGGGAASCCDITDAAARSVVVTSNLWRMRYAVCMIFTYERLPKFVIAKIAAIENLTKLFNLRRLRQSPQQLPNATSVLWRHRLAGLTAESFVKFRHIADYAIHAPLA